MRKSVRIFTLVLSFLLLAGLLAGCGKKKNAKAAEDAVSSATGKGAGSSTEKYEYKTTQNGFDIIVGNKLEVPKWWVKWMPITTDANIVNTQINDKTGEKLIQFSTQQGFDKVFSYYKNAFEKEEKYSESKTEEGGNMMFNKENHFVSIIYIPEPAQKGCVLQIMLAEGQSAPDMTDAALTAADFGNTSGDFSNGTNLYSDGNMGKYYDAGGAGTEAAGSSNIASGYVSNAEMSNASNAGSGSSSGSSGTSSNGSSFEEYATELSTDYPKNLVPLFPDATVIYSYSDEYEGLKQFSVHLLTAKKFKEVVTFYNKQLSSMENKEQQGDTDFIEITGVKDNFDIRLAITDGGTETNISIEIMGRSTPQQAFDRITAYEQSLKSPYHLIPVIPGAKITDAYENIWEGGKSYSVHSVSMSSVKEICDFYNDKVKMIDKEVQNNGDEFRVDGKIDGYFIYITGVTNSYGPYGEYRFIDYSIEYTPMQ